MVEHEFYVNCYMGSAIPGNAFSGMAAQAQYYLDRFKETFRVVSSGEEAEKMALCAMAETLWYRRDSGVSSASVGSVRVQYGNNRPSLLRELFEKASIYLDIYRGVKA